MKELPRATWARLVEATVDFNRFLGAMVMVEVVATKHANNQVSVHLIVPKSAARTLDGTQGST